MINYIEDEILSNSTIPQSEELTLTQFTSELLERTPNSLNDVNNIINDFKQGLNEIIDTDEPNSDIIDTFTFRCFKHFKENTTFTGTEIEEITKLLSEKAEELREDIEKSFDYFKLCCEYVDILEPKLGKRKDYERRLELIENIKPNLTFYKETFINKQTELDGYARKLAITTKKLEEVDNDILKLKNDKKTIVDQKKNIKELLKHLKENKKEKKECKKVNIENINLEQLMIDIKNIDVEIKENNGKIKLLTKQENIIKEEIKALSEQRKLIEAKNENNETLKTIKQLSNELEEQTRVLTNYKNSAVL